MPHMLMVTTISRFLRDFLFPHADHFRARGWRVDAMTNEVDAYPVCRDHFDHIWEVRWSRNPLDPRNLLRTPGAIRELVAREQYDIIHVHTPVAAFVTRYALRHRQERPSIVYTAHGFHFHPAGDLVKNTVFSTLERMAGRWTDYLIVINREDEHAAQRYKLIAQEQLRYMPGIGVDCQQHYHPGHISDLAVHRIRRELGLRHEDRYLAMVAEFIPRKRHADAIRAFSYIRDPTVHLVLAGCGPLEAEMQQMVLDFEVSDRVHFLGFRDDVAALIRGAIATLLPSAQEGLPRSILESMSLGVPVIGTDIRGIRELPINSCGRLIALGDVAALANAMHWMVQHPAEAAALGAHGRTHIEPYSLQRILSMHETLYAEALGDHRPEVPLAKAG